MSMKNSNDSSWDFFNFLNFFIVLICLHVFCRHNRARCPPTRLVYGHKTKRDGTVACETMEQVNASWFVL